MQEDAQFLHDRTPVIQSTRSGPALVVKQLNNKTGTKIQYKNPYTPHATLKENLKDMQLKHQQAH
eukprot:11922250-Ditylum_brightwellii.AAC.1